ncbi:hypothetical protein AAFF_G00413880 [Aldrovandia affinis]|uniref:Fibronectin type-III domain-containing protein n=1 Tax=Aldrovandia affinis TaxID=143900 RepID=A0AAD7SB53_9TELE|nr:hypothetical protein AAFF_G00413880 [Aldrovandia affinis]
MVCNLNSSKPLNCSRYGLDLAEPTLGHFTCTFTSTSRESNSLSNCECTVQMLQMVATEKYNMSLLEGGRVINSRSITAIENIKPKAPEISSVMPTKNGDYNVTWKMNYAERGPFLDSLITELSYKRKGGKVSVIVNPPLHFFEIPGSQLEPGSDYAVKARSYSTFYDTQFSDWSQEVVWTTASSDWNVLMFVILAVCAFLVSAICAFYWCCVRLKEKWWIPTPMNEIKDMLPGNAKVFIPSNFDPSSNDHEILTVGKTEEEPWLTTQLMECDQDDPYKNVNCCAPAKDSGVSSSDDSHRSLSVSEGSCGSSESGYKNCVYPREATPSPGSSSPGLPGSAWPALRSEPGLVPLMTSDLRPPDLEALDLLGRAPDPCVSTDFEYRPCDGGVVAGSPPAGGAGPPCPFNADSPDTSLPSAGVDTCRVEDGYEPFGEAVNRTQTHFPACTLGPCEEGYQALHTLVENRTYCLSGAGEAEEEAC